jgi:hypothetical protein
MMLLRLKTLVLSASLDRGIRHWEDAGAISALRHGRKINRPVSMMGPFNLSGVTPCFKAATIGFRPLHPVRCKQTAQPIVVVANAEPTVGAWTTPDNSCYDRRKYLGDIP